MRLHELKVAAKIERRRVGRGIAAGRGKTAGRGTKGQGSRSGASLRPTFEGGQNPLIQRLPKQRGFTSRRLSSQLIKTGQLNRFGANQTIKLTDLQAAGLIRGLDRPVRLVKAGELTKARQLEVHGASRAAAQVVAAAKGQLKIINFKSSPRVRQPKMQAK